MSTDGLTPRLSHRPAASSDTCVPDNDEMHIQPLELAA
jgi:hypothetical protein